MVKDFCDMLQKKVAAANLPFADIVAGVVKTVTEENFLDNDAANADGQLGKRITYRYPVSWSYVRDPSCDGVLDGKELVPDSSKKGMVYFEDNGANIINTVGSVYGTTYQANITAVAWYNKANIFDNPNAITQARFQTLLMNALGVNKNPFNFLPFKRIMLQSTRIQTNDGAIFNKYSYREADRQYLMPPFEYFAIDFTAQFTVKETCIADNSSTPNPCN